MIQNNYKCNNPRTPPPHPPIPASQYDYSTTHATLLARPFSPPLSPGESAMALPVTCRASFDRFVGIRLLASADFSLCCLCCFMGLSREDGSVIFLAELLDFEEEADPVELLTLLLVSLLSSASPVLEEPVDYFSKSNIIFQTCATMNANSVKIRVNYFYINILL